MSDPALFEKIKGKIKPKAVGQCPNAPGDLAVYVSRADNHKPVADAQVKASGPTPGAGQTDAQGWVIFPDRTPGAYKADVQLPAALSKFQLPSPTQAGAVACAKTEILHFQISPPPTVRPLIEAPPVVVVKRPYTKAERKKVTLKADIAFDGTGVLSRSGNAVEFYTTASAGSALKFDGNDNKFTGANLTGGVTLYAEGARASGAVDDIELKLALSGGTKTIGPDVRHKMTSVEVTLDICEPRPAGAPAGDPPALPTAAAAPVGGAAATDKFYLGRPVPVEQKTDNPFPSERAMLIIRRVKPAGFSGNFSLDALDDKVAVFAAENPSSAEKPLPLPHLLTTGSVPPNGKKFFVQGMKPSGGARDTGLTLGLKGVADDGDRVAVTAVYVEAVSNVETAKLKTVAVVPEKPARASKSKYAPAPIIIGKDYDVEIRPYLEVAVAKTWAWSTTSAHLTLADAAKEVLKVHGKSLSGALNDVEIELMLTLDVGKMKKKHKLTVVHVEIDPVTSGDNVKHTDPINFIKNPSGCVILTGADASDATKVPKYEITKIQPNLAWTDDDDRIAWWILGGEAKAASKYDGKADFMNTDAAKRGKKIQVFGGTQGDVLIQPYSGGYGYGMIRVHVIPIRQVKYRISRIFTTAQAAKPAVPAQPGFPAQAALPAFPGNGVLPAMPAVPALPAVAARPLVPAVPARAAHAPTTSHAEADIHMKISNIFLRQMGIQMIPDTSAEMASPVRAASAGFPAVAVQAAVAAQPATPAVGAVPARPPVPARPVIPARPAIPAVAASVANNKVGLAALDPKVIAVTQVSPGHFDVEVSDPALTFNSAANQKPAIQINARNEVISVAYIEQDPTLGTGTTTLSTALLCPANHAPKTRARQPEVYAAANFTLTDQGTPSSSLIPKTGLPPDTPADPVKLIVLFPDVSWQAASPATRDVNLLWGIVVPTRNMDSAVKAPITVDKTRHMYGFVFAHEMGHILGLGHRGDITNPVTDGLALPADKNIMRPFVNVPVTENFDLVQTKAVRFSEVMSRTP